MRVRIKQGRTANDLARENNHKEVVEFLSAWIPLDDKGPNLTQHREDRSTLRNTSSSSCSIVNLSKSLDALPYIVLDNILGRLDNQSLVSCSKTCHVLYTFAKPHLYSIPVDYRLEGFVDIYWLTPLEYSLSRNPYNARYVRFYQSTSISLLGELASVTPLWLDELELYHGLYENRHIAEEWKNFISSMHLKPYINCIKFQSSMGDTAIDSGSILESLNVFHDLVRLELGSMYGHTNLRKIFDIINCPQLKYIKVCLDNDADWHVLPSHNLPNIESLRFELCMELLERNDDATWKFLKSAEERGIYIQIQEDTDLDWVVTFFKTVHKFAQPTDLQPIIRWLAKGEHHFQTQIDRKSIFEIDLRDLSAGERDLTLEALQNFQPQPDGYKLSIFRDDNTLPSPQKVSRLEISLIDSDIRSDFIPTFLGSSSGLSIFTVHEYGVLSNPHTLVRPSLTPFTYTIPLCEWLDEEEEGDFEQGFHEIVIGRNGQVHCRYSNDDGDDEDIEDVDAGMLKLVGEVKGWFKENMSIQEIKYIIWSGNPWGFRFMDY